MSAVTGVGVGRKCNVILVANLIVLMSSSGCSDRGRPKDGGDGNPVPVEPKDDGGDGGGENSLPENSKEASIDGVDENPAPVGPKNIQIANLSSQETALADFGLVGDVDLDETVAMASPLFGALPQTIDLVPTPMSRGNLQQSLRPGNWLEDDVINAYFSILQKNAAPGYKLVGADFWWNFKVHLNQFDFGQNRNFDFMIFPLNTGLMHWTLGALDFKAKEFLHFDSTSGALPRDFETKMKLYLNKLKVPTVDWTLRHQALGWQKNWYDCGVFTCFIAERLAVGQVVDFSGFSDIPQQGLDILRRRIAAKLVEDAKDTLKRA